MTAPVAGQYVWCIDLDDETIGFLCAMHEDNTPQGALVDNLHLLPASRDHGVDRCLVDRAVRWAVAQGITQLHLLAYGANTATVDFYEALDGMSVSRDWLKTAGGGHTWVHTYHWPEAEFESLTYLS